MIRDLISLLVDQAYCTSLINLRESRKNGKVLRARGDSARRDEVYNAFTTARSWNRHRLSYYSHHLLKDVY